MILCKVVDNYGDIGFVYRLSRSLSEKYPDSELSLVVSNLASFSAMAPKIKEVPYQKYNGWNILDWNASSECKSFFTENPAPLILECFQCGRPEWLDEILFDKNRTETVQIVNIEYLTAETWADDFHLLKSGTRSALVKKINFMPGFTEKTGGLVLDKEFMESLGNKKSALEKLRSGIVESSGNDTAEKIISYFSENQDGKKYFNITVFAYEKNLEPLVSALSDFQTEQRKKAPDFSLNVFAANGLSFKSFSGAWEKYGKPFCMTPLPYMNQSAWDALLVLCDFNFIRGEDSFSRACLSGKPFIWNAYVQDEEFQIVKVRAFIDLIKKFFMEEKLEKEFEDFNDAMLLYNKTENFNPGNEAAEAFVIFNGENEKDALKKTLSDFNASKRAFENFSRNLIGNGCISDGLKMFFQDRAVL
ncbi:MAG: elongation factor P maturation arginine rhamnosyltransferase EarP [Treponema sp.]|nr:elongation factor P maturation arginine rhamnosyltransferase EarP [Treponema sp.]